MKKAFKEDFAVVFLIAVIIIFYSITKLTKDEVNESIENNKYSTIAKVYEIASSRSSRSVKYKYFFDKKTYFSSEFIETKGTEYLNQYFKVELSTVEPQHSNIFLDIQIKDTFKIKMAGFKIK